MFPSHKELVHWNKQPVALILQWGAIKALQKKTPQQDEKSNIGRHDRNMAFIVFISPYHFIASVGVKV